MELPNGDEAEDHEIWEEQRRDGRGSIDQVIEHVG